MSTLQRDVRFGEWKATEYAKNRWKFVLANKKIVLTGGADTKDLELPFFHTLQRIEVTQNTTAGVADASSFDFAFAKKIGSDPDISESRATLISSTGLLFSDYAVNWTKDSFEREPTKYTFTITGTATNEMFLEVYVDGAFKL